MVELTLNIFSAVNLSVLSIFLFFRRSNSITNRIFALIIFCPALNFINNIFIWEGWIYSFPHTLFFSFATAQLYAPLVYIYVNLFIGKKTKIFNPLFAFTLFIILLDFYFWWEFSQFPLKQKIIYLTGLTTYNYPWQMNTINGLFVIAEFIYFTASLINVFRFSKIVKEFYSEEDEIKLRYIKKFIILIFSLNSFLIVVYAILPTPSVEYIFLPLFLNIIYLYILYNAFKHSALFSYNEFQHFARKIEPVALVEKNIHNPGKISKSNYHLKQELGDQLYSKVLKHLIEKKPYLDPNYHIEDLAQELKIRKHHLSFVINSRFQKSFFELVNTYRIEEAKEKLKNDSGCHSVDAIGYDVGFNTKSAFYRAFKKHTNLTPAQFCKIVKSEQSLK